MIFLLDTNILRELFIFYFIDALELREPFDHLLENKKILSVKEVYNELSRQFSKNSEIMNWLKTNKHIFLKPESKEEIDYIKQIYRERNFQNNIAHKSILQGRPVADPFLVAKAKSKECCVVTSEIYKKNAAKIPNLCEFLEVKCLKREDFISILKS
jgi:hypothetical protein